MVKAADLILSIIQLRPRYRYASLPRITSDLSLEDELEFDSLEELQLVLAIEHQMGIKIDRVAIDLPEYFKTVGSLEDLLETIVREQNTEA